MKKKPANFNHSMTFDFDLRSMDSLHGFIRETLSMDDFAHDFSLALFFSFLNCFRAEFFSDIFIANCFKEVQVDHLLIEHFELDSFSIRTF